MPQALRRRPTKGSRNRTRMTRIMSWGIHVSRNDVAKKSLTRQTALDRGQTDYISLTQLHFNPRQDIVITYSHAKGQEQRSVRSKDRLDTSRQTDGWKRRHSMLMQSVNITKHAVAWQTGRYNWDGENNISNRKQEIRLQLYHDCATTMPTDKQNSNLILQLCRNKFQTKFTTFLYKDGIEY